MPDLSSYLAQIRADGHAPRLYMSAFTGSAILVGTISVTPTLPALTLVYTTTSGSSSNVKRGMRVVITTSGGEYKGETSVRYAGTITSTHLPIRETGQGEFGIESGDIVTVYDTFILSDKLVAANSSFAPDHETYVAQNSTVAPLVRSGGYWAGPLNAGQTYATVPFVGASETVDEDSGATVTHAWSAPTATGTTSSTSTNPTFTFPAGEHLVIHEGEDSSNSAVFTQYVKVKPDTNPFEVQLESWSTEAEPGASATVRMLSSATLDELPDGCLVVLWHPAFVVPRSTVASRKHIFMVGYLRRDNSVVDPEGDELTFEIQSPLAKLAETSGFSKAMIRNASPTKWREVEGLTVRRAVLILLRYYTNVCDIGFDFEFDAEDYDWNRFYLQANTPRDQVVELADGVDARFVCDRTGRLMVQQRLELLNPSDRAAETITLTLRAEDILNLEMSREHDRPVQQVRGEGFIASATNPTPILARWPGVPMRGTLKQTFQRLIVSSRRQFNQRVSHRGAALNRTYTRGAGIQDHAPEVTLILRGGYDVFDHYREFIRINMDETTNPRGIDLSAFRWLLVSASVTMDPDSGGTETSLHLKAETAGRPAKKHEDPTPEQTAVPTPTPIRYEIGFSNPGQVGLRLPTYTGDLTNVPDRIFAVSADAAECATGEIDWIGQTITWTVISTGLTGTGQHACGDPYDYARRLVLTTDGLFEVSDPWEFDGFVQVASNAELFGNSARIGWKIQGDITRRGHFIVGCGHNHALTFDNFNTIEQIDPSGSGTWFTSNVIATGQNLDDFAISQTDGRVVIAGHYASGGSSDVLQSTDGGRTYSVIQTTPSAFTSPRYFLPYRKSTGAANMPNASMEIWMAHASGNAVSYDRGITWNYVFAGVAAGNAPAAGTQSVISHFTWDARKRYVAGYGTGGNRWTIYRTVDGTTYTVPVNALSGRQDAVSIQGWGLNPNVVLMYARSGGPLLEISNDGAVTRFGTSPFGASHVTYAEFDLSEVVPSGSGAT